MQPHNLFVLEFPTPKYPPSDRKYIRKPLSLKPSACTPLFLAAFEQGAGCCIHTHSQWAVLVTLLVEREKFHSAVLTEALGTTDTGTMQRLVAGSTPFGRGLADAGAAQTAGTAALGRAASGQAFALAFADTFTIVAVVLGLGALLVWALPAIPADRPKPRPARAERRYA